MKYEQVLSDFIMNLEDISRMFMDFKMNFISRGNEYTRDGYQCKNY